MAKITRKCFISSYYIHYWMLLFFRDSQIKVHFFIVRWLFVTNSINAGKYHRVIKFHLFIYRHEKYCIWMTFLTSNSGHLLRLLFVKHIYCHHFCQNSIRFELNHTCCRWKREPITNILQSINETYMSAYILAP